MQTGCVMLKTVAAQTNSSSHPIRSKGNCFQNTWAVGYIDRRAKPDLSLYHLQNINCHEGNNNPFMFHLMNYVMLLQAGAQTLQCVVLKLAITFSLSTSRCLPVDGNKLRVEDQSCSTY